MSRTTAKNRQIYPVENDRKDVNGLSVYSLVSLTVYRRFESLSARTYSLNLRILYTFKVVAFSRQLADALAVTQDAPAYLGGFVRAYMAVDRDQPYHYKALHAIFHRAQCLCNLYM